MYTQVSNHDDDDHISGPPPVPSSPPPPFTSRPASPTESQTLLSRHDPLTSDADRTLAETFDSPSDDDVSDDEDEDAQENRRLVRQNTDQNRNTQTSSQPPVETRVQHYPVFATTTSQVYGGGRANDGVFANLSAKPTRGEELEEKPPSYEQAAADATPPYWETTILAPGMLSDEVYVDGLPVGSVFSFVWNAMISMSFQIVGFLLTYLLHTTHAAKNGSRAGLGITLVQYGFSMKSASSLRTDPTGLPVDSNGAFAGSPTDPNAHDFDPAKEGESGGFDQGMGSGIGGISTTDWFAYILMVVGWFILIRSVSDFLRARRHEQLVLQSPERGLGVAVVAEGEGPETSV
ncbi:hypothetical protein BT63DRAFT_378431 [Microthyrium microscopicum]|uniref:Metal homeostatis protein bsd2 n=1 Tax=Microthyrium microscopicum TaxID=703497 RepID=A0A6A6TZF0_9PEZI|nr:hypothetical protein BT63DRAFT_378431 [Microthyrium microscopicum]